MIYNIILSELKKKTPSFYKSLKKVKNKIFYNENFIKKLNNENGLLIKSFRTENFYNFAKKEFLENKDKKSSEGVLEINNSCNINCVMCDTKSSSRKKKLMNLDLCEKAVKEMHEQGIRNIILHTIGDPLANAKLKDYLKILRKYNMQVGMSTNGLMLDKHVETLVEYFDICSNIRFSIDGVKKETYEKIRFGGKFDKLIENLDLAEKRLRKIGYEFSIESVITKDNFNEMGEYIVFFRKYINNPYKNMHFNFMTSLAPSNDYFLGHNTMEEHTSKNYFCKYASSLTPYVLVDGRVSACCRDYDGSLVVDDINENKLKTMNESVGFKSLQNAHLEESNKVENYELCKTCYVIDTRISRIWRNAVTSLLFKYPNENADFYQNFFNETFLFLKNIHNQDFKKITDKYSLA